MNDSGKVVDGKAEMFNQNCKRIIITTPYSDIHSVLKAVNYLFRRTAMRQENSIYTRGWHFLIVRW